MHTCWRECVCVRMLVRFSWCVPPAVCCAVHQAARYTTSVFASAGGFTAASSTSRVLSNTYSNPVVLGQVLTSADMKFQTCESRVLVSLSAVVWTCVVWGVQSGAGGRRWPQPRHRQHSAPVGTSARTQMLHGALRTLDTSSSKAGHASWLALHLGCSC